MVVSFTEMCKTRGIPSVRKVKIHILNFRRKGVFLFILLVCLKVSKKEFWEKKHFSAQFYELFTFETKLRELIFICLTNY